MVDADVGKVLTLVEQAGRAIMEIYRSAEHEVETKGDNSPITRADRTSHELLVKGLEQVTPGIRVLSEESEDCHDLAVRGHWREYWLIDPLDGTREFIGRNGEFTVNVALIRDHRPVMGVVAAPALGLTYYATQAGGAYRVRDGARPEPIHVQPTHAPPIVVGSRSHRGDSLDGVLQRLGNYELKPMGSALKFCLVAEGSADFYPRLGPTSEWDTAAAQAVLETAGGTVCGLDGLPLRYNERPTLLNPHFLAYGDASRDWLQLL